MEEILISVLSNLGLGINSAAFGSRNFKETFKKLCPKDWEIEFGEVKGDNASVRFPNGVVLVYTIQCGKVTALEITQ